MKEQLEDDLTFKELILKAKEWIGYLVSKWKIIVVFGLLGGSLGALDAYFDKWEYTGTLSFAIEDEKSGGGLSGALGLASQFGIDVGGGSSSIFGGANLIELMKSRSLVEKALLKPVIVENKEISLAEFYLDFNDWKKGWDTKPQLKNISFLPNADRSKFSLQQDSILGLIYQTLVFKNLKVEQRDKKVSIITIDVKTGNEIFCKVFTETLAKEVSEFYIETKSKKSRNAVAILEKQADSVRNELNLAINGVASSNDNTFNLNPGLNIKRAPTVRRQVDVQANTAILTELVKNLELSRMAMRKETPLIQIIDKPVYPLNKYKKGKFKQAIIGGILGGIFIVVILIGKNWWKEQMA